MRIYVDSSALLKRVVIEPDSDALIAVLRRHVADEDALVSSALAWIEVSRALRTRWAGEADQSAVADATDVAMSGIDEYPINAEVVSLARRMGPAVMRNLDAIHLATSVLVDADFVVTFDARLAAACSESGLAVRAPTAADRPQVRPQSGLFASGGLERRSRE